MIKTLALVFVALAAAGILAGKLGVTLLAILMLPFLWYANGVFAKQDAEWDRLNPPDQLTSLEELDRGECSCNCL